MADLAAVLKELQQERSRLEQAIEVIGKLVVPKGTRGTTRTKRTLSVAARQRIAAAQRARWAKVRAKQLKRVA